jgi:GNAT superfamily N-acetyltransferase
MLEAYSLEPEAFTSSVGERENLSLEWWSNRIAAEPEAHERVIGAFLGHELAGVAGLSFEQRERTRHKATLFGMYVRPAARGRGIAKALVEEVLRQARRSQITEVVQLTVTESNLAAVRLYAYCGFIPFGTEPFAVKSGDGFLNKVHMWRRVAEREPD